MGASRLQDHHSESKEELSSTLAFWAEADFEEFFNGLDDDVLKFNRINIFLSKNFTAPQIERLKNKLERLQTLCDLSVETTLDPANEELVNALLSSNLVNNFTLGNILRPANQTEKAVDKWIQSFSPALKSFSAYLTLTPNQARELLKFCRRQLAANKFKLDLSDTTMPDEIVGAFFSLNEPGKKIKINLWRHPYFERLKRTLAMRDLLRSGGEIFETLNEDSYSANNIDEFIRIIHSSAPEAPITTLRFGGRDEESSLDPNWTQFISQIIPKLTSITHIDIRNSDSQIDEEPIFTALMQSFCHLPNVQHFNCSWRYLPNYTEATQKAFLECLAHIKKTAKDISLMNMQLPINVSKLATVQLLSEDKDSPNEVRQLNLSTNDINHVEIAHSFANCFQSKKKPLESLCLHNTNINSRFVEIFGKNLGLLKELVISSNNFDLHYLQEGVANSTTLKSLTVSVSAYAQAHIEGTLASFIEEALKPNHSITYLYTTNVLSGKPDWEISKSEWIDDSSKNLIKRNKLFQKMREQAERQTFVEDIIVFFSVTRQFCKSKRGLPSVIARYLLPFLYQAPPHVKSAEAERCVTLVESNLTARDSKGDLVRKWNTKLPKDGKVFTLFHRWEHTVKAPISFTKASLSPTKLN